MIPDVVAWWRRRRKRLRRVGNSQNGTNQRGVQCPTDESEGL
jgi:hypothetical protein